MGEVETLGATFMAGWVLIIVWRYSASFQQVWKYSASLGMQDVVCMKKVWHIEDAGMQLEDFWNVQVDSVVSAGVQKL